MFKGPLCHASRDPLASNENAPCHRRVFSLADKQQGGDQHPRRLTCSAPGDLAPQSQL